MAKTYKYVPFEYVIAHKVQLKQHKGAIYLLSSLLARFVSPLILHSHHRNKFW